MQCLPHLGSVLQAEAQQGTSRLLEVPNGADCKYWDAFVASCNEKLWNTPQPPVDCIEFWESILEYLKANPLGTIGEANVIKRLTRCHDICRLWVVHFTMRDYLKKLLEEDLARPCEGTLYAWSDWKDSSVDGSCNCHPTHPMDQLSIESSPCPME